jgi:hypothetical protein
VLRTYTEKWNFGIMDIADFDHKEKALSAFKTQHSNIPVFHHSK